MIVLAQSSGFLKGLAMPCKKCFPQKFTGHVLVQPLRQPSDSGVLELPCWLLCSREEYDRALTGGSNGHSNWSTPHGH